MKKLIILGAGMAGTMMANKLRKQLSSEWTIVLIDKDDEHVYQPGLLFLPFGIYRREDIVRPRRSFIGEGIEFVISDVERVDPEARTVEVSDGVSMHYDLLVVATGCRTTPEATAGLT